jgi:exopolyphosphatase/guanosine-5'-triphosphate,3'-diphosphate pyrophosphatase
MRVAAIDCGTNSIRLLIADVSASGMRDVVREMTVVRLGQGVDATGRFADDAIARTFAACDQYAAQCARKGVERIRFVATSATRDAANRDVFIRGVEERLGEEAALSFAGATRELLGNTPSPFLVLDIGGGSTEFVLGIEAPLAARSMNVGCVRMTERHRITDRPSEESLAAATEDIDEAILEAAGTVPLHDAKTLVGVAGSVTTVAAHALGLLAYDPYAIHLARLSLAQVQAASDDFSRATASERAALPYMHPGRVDVIPAGALILRRVMEVGGFDRVLVSEHDILDGIAWSIAS